MSYAITTDNELDGLSRLLYLILGKGKQNGNYLEILSCLLTISYNPIALACFQAFREKFFNIAGQTGIDGWNRATRVYTTTNDLPTKPSYLRRLVEYPDQPRKAPKPVSYINQIDTIASELAKKPGFSTLSFVLLRPADLIDKFRPGYVPCPIAGDFKFRDEKLHLSVMFRTSDAFAVGYADIFYLREIQKRVLEKAKERASGGKIYEGGIGDLNLYFSRTFMERKHKVRDPVTKTEKLTSIKPLAEKLAGELSHAAESQLIVGRSNKRVL
jgi:hypothetical protein